MNEISGLRAHRDRVAQLLDEMDAVKEEDLQALHDQAQDDWTNLRRTLAPATISKRRWRGRSSATMTGASDARIERPSRS